MKREKISLDTVLQFGQNKGKTSKELIDNGEYQYVEWMLENVKQYRFDKEIKNYIEQLEAESQDIKNNI